MSDAVNIDNLTLSEIEAIAARLEAAAKVFRDARALLGGAAGAQPAQTQPHTPVVLPTPVGPPTRVRTPLSDAELADLAAQKAALLTRNIDLPEDLARAERTPPP